MLSNKPYLLRAFYEWIVDSDCTPYLVVNAETKNVQVPQDFIEDGRIVLNVSPRATRDLEITNKSVDFRASFGGNEQFITAPIQSVIAIYATENGQGMVFDEEEVDASADSADFEDSNTRPDLKIIE